MKNILTIFIVYYFGINILLAENSIIKGKSIAKNIAAVGHEADSIVATEEAYNALPACCLYNSVSPHGG